MIAILGIAAFLGGLAAPAIAQDVDAGAAAFRQQCQTCHVVVNAEGEALAGKKARTGPNLYRVVGAEAANVDGFRYGKGLLAAAGAGLVWDEPSFLAYLANTNDFLRIFTGDDKVRSRMAWKVKKEEDARNIHAFLMSLQ